MSLEEKLKIAILLNQSLKQKNENYQYQKNIYQERILDMEDQIALKHRTI